MPVFRAEVHQNEYLPLSERQVHAVVRVTCTDPGTGDGLPAEIVILDCSGSMAGSKIRYARRAATAALEAIPDGTAFAVVAGASGARVVHPGRRRPGMDVMSERTRARA